MNGPSAVVSANILPVSFKMKNGNPVSMGKIRPNNSTYYGSVAASNLNTINSLQASTDNYRLMTPTIPSRDSSRANQSSSYVNSSTEKDDLAPSRQNFAKTTSSMFADIHSNRPSSSSTGKNNLNSTFPAMGNANNATNNNNTNSSNSAGNTSLFSSSQPISSTSNFYTNGSGGGGSANGFVNKFNSSVSGSNNATSGGSQYNNYPYPTSSNNNSSSGGFNPKSTFVRSLTAPSPVLTLNHNNNNNNSNNNNNQSDFRTASSSSAHQQVNMNNIIGMDGRKEWNIRDSMTIPPIRHNPANDYNNSGGAFSNLFGEAFLNTENSDSTEANTNLGSLSKSMKSLKRVRFSDPICLYEPMTNTLRNRIIHESQKLVEMNGNNNNNNGLKSVLKVGGGGGGGGRNGEFSEPPSSSSHQLQQQMQLNTSAMNPNPNLITINTATNTMSNKTVANTVLSKIMNNSAMTNRPISAPINGLKRIMETQQQQVAAQQPAPNPLLSSRDQIVKKSLIELQTKIVSNLASLSGENNNINSGGTSESKQQTQEQITKERDENKLFQVTSMTGLQSQINETNNNTSSKNNNNNTNNNTVNTNSTNSPNNRSVDDSRRPKSASYSSHQQQMSNSGSSSMEAMKAFVPSVSAALFSASNNTHTHQNNNNNNSHNDTSNNNSSNNNQQLVPVNRGPALFNLMAKSILIGNYSCRVVNNIQFFADHFEFLFPIYDFSQSNGLPFSSNNTGITGAGGNYSSLKGLCIYYKDVSNITLLSNKMRCRLAPNWFSSDSNNNNSDNANNNNNNNTSSLAAIHGYLCIEFSSLSYMIILREKIIPVMSNFTK
jgi:hypothetical protein